MGSGFLHFLGGAMQGYGQGMAAQAEMDWKARREAELQRMLGERALTVARQEQADRIDLADHTSELKKDEATHAAAVAVERKRREAPIEVDTKRQTTQIETAAKLQVIDAQGQKDAVIARLKGSIDRSNDAASQQLKDALEQNDRTLVVGEDGYYRLIGDDGTEIKTKTKATAKEVEGSRNTTGGSLIEQLRQERGGGGTTPASKPAAAPEPKPRLPLRARQEAREGAGAPRMTSDAQATAFVNNPANKGKSFVGPDGKRYRVPE